MQQGFAYVVVLALLAIMAVGSAAVSSAWSAELRRDRERELVRIGLLYAKAIDAYQAAVPGGVKQYPVSLDDLLIDTRFTGTVRHLRRLYADPTQPTQPWGQIRSPDGSIRGVHSTNPAEPLRREPLEMGIVSLPAAKRYSDWIFAPKVSP